MGKEDLEQLLAAVEAQLGTSWTDVVEFLRENNQLEDIAAHVRAGDIDGAVQGVEQAATRFASEVHDAYVDAAKMAAKAIDDVKDRRLVTFSGDNPRAVAWAKDNAAGLVRGISQQQREAVTQAISRGLSEGRNPIEVATEVRDSIGLTPAQEQHVASYRRALEAGDHSNALDRKLSSGHSDRTIRAAEAADRKLTPKQIDLAVDRYRSNWIDHRAETIARTEGLRALHQGVEEATQQAIDDGHIEADELVQEWHTAGDSHVRESHRHVLSESGSKTKTISEDWVTADGNRLRFPGDPSAPVEETANCRCVVSTTIEPSRAAA